MRDYCIICVCIHVYVCVYTHAYINFNNELLEYMCPAKWMANITNNCERCGIYNELYIHNMVNAEMNFYVLGIPVHVNRMVFCDLSL